MTDDATPEDLWKTAMDMARAMATKAHQRSRYVADREDFEQSAFLALWEAALSYDACNDRGASFSTYAWRLVRNELFTEEMRQCPLGFTTANAQYRGRLESLPRTVPLPDEGRESEDAWLAKDDDAFELLEENDLCRFFLSRLPEKHRIVVRRHYLEGLSRETIARQMGVNPTSVILWLKEARIRMRKWLTVATGEEHDPQR